MQENNDPPEVPTPAETQLVNKPLPIEERPLEYPTDNNRKRADIKIRLTGLGSIIFFFIAGFANSPSFILWHQANYYTEADYSAASQGSVVFLIIAIILLLVTISRIVNQQRSLQKQLPILPVIFGLVSVALFIASVIPAIAISSHPSNNPTGQAFAMWGPSMGITLSIIIFVISMIRLATNRIANKSDSPILVVKKSNKFQYIIYYVLAFIILTSIGGATGPILIVIALLVQYLFAKKKAGTMNPVLVRNIIIGIAVTIVVIVFLINRQWMFPG